jgi:hypothetical protein
MAANKPPADTQPSVHERVASLREKSASRQTIIIVGSMLIIFAAMYTYGVPTSESGEGSSDLYIVAVLALAAYFIFIRKRKQEVDAEALVAMVIWYWKSSSLNHHTWDRIEPSMTGVQIERVTDDFHLVSCDNPHGGTKTLGIHGDDGRNLTVVEVFNGDAAAARKQLETSKFVGMGLEKGLEVKKIEAMLDRN